MSFPSLTLSAALLALSAACSGAQSPEDAAELEPRTYSLYVDGAVEVEAEGLPIGDDDPGVSDEEILAGEAQSRYVYSPDPIDSDSNIATGPFRIMMMLGPEFGSSEEHDALAVQASLHLTDEVEPGEYEINEGFFDVGPNAVPVSAMAVAVTADRSFQLPLTNVDSGWIRLTEFGEEASGSFEFIGVELDGERTATVRGAFQDAPLIPMSELEENQ